MKPMSRSWFVLTLLISFLAISCTSQGESGSATENVVVTNTVIRTPLLITPSFTTPRTSTTPTRTFTSLPTLSPDDAMEFVTEMIQTNGGCELPCWWGIIPGESHWSDARRFLEPIALEIDDNYPSFGQHMVIYPHPVFGSTYTLFYVKDGIINLMDVIETIGIQSSLQRFGIPDEVWVFSTGNIQGHAEQDLALFYPSKGILIYFATSVNPGWTSTNVLQFCSEGFSDTSGHALSRFSLWSQGNFTTFNYFTPYLPKLEPPSRYARINEVSSLDEESFYDLFSTNMDACFETANDIWTKKLLPTITATP
jgi:hypothetical protein